ncbi:MAG TPA: ABC transporter permease [Polyangiaceae bacterium]|nr:ABC transporter permease [Polyangiaceae bacterium]
MSARASVHPPSMRPPSLRPPPVGTPRSRGRPGSLRFALRSLRKQRLPSACALLMAMLALMAIFAEELASSRPIACRFHGEVHLLANVTHPHALAGVDKPRFEAERQPGDWAIWPLVACGPEQACRGSTEARPPLVSLSSPLGTDARGRDVFARLVYGTRSALGVALLAVAAFVLLGAVLGAVAGFFGGPFDFFVARVIETLSAFPVPLLALVVQALVPHPGLFSLLAVIAGLRWTEVARLVRAEVLAVSPLDYVTAARALGATPWRVLYKHVLPMTMTPVVVAAVLGLGQIVLLESALDFLRVGLPSSVPTWGEILSESRDHFGAWWLLLLPGALVFVSVMATNALGEALRDALDPRAAA